jgi:hypothetical protein
MPPHRADGMSASLACAVMSFRLVSETIRRCFLRLLTPCPSELNAFPMQVMAESTRTGWEDKGARKRFHSRY